MAFFCPIYLIYIILKQLMFIYLHDKIYHLKLIYNFNKAFKCQQNII